jgi:DHA2 family methylenomycin A resistance protein-like MFS transporter
MFLCYGAGTDAITPNLTIFVKTITHCSDNAAQHCLMIVLLAMGISIVPCGLIADRVGTKRMLAAGFLLVGAASLCGLWVQTLPQIWCVMALAGVATAAQNAAAYPLLTRLVPSREIGFYTGLQSAVISVTGPLAIWLTGTLINHGGYRMIFAVCSMFTIAAAVFLAPIQVDAARREIAAREAEG